MTTFSGEKVCSHCGQTRRPPLIVPYYVGRQHGQPVYEWCCVGQCSKERAQQRWTEQTG